jgi:hypothetical protein
VPILNGAVGKYSIFAMALVCGVAYGVGSVIRFNISNAEPLLENDQIPKRTKHHELASDLALVGAYVISVCLYINILASFLLGGMHFLGDTVKDNDLIMLAGKASVLLPLPLVIAAVLSQFSAAVADTLGGSGNTVEATHNRVDMKHATLLICGGGVIPCFAPTLTILALASRAFAFYYMLQCLVASGLAKPTLQRCFFYLLAAVLAFITLFAVPAG